MKETLPLSMKTLLEQVKTRLLEQGEDPKLYETFENCYTNTLDTTVKEMPDGTTYVITGDIPAMWLRDSVAQVRPYLVLARQDRKIADLLAGLVKRQFFYIGIDPYANAFNEEANGNCWEHDDTDQMSDYIWERKYEIDSLCYPVQLAYLLWQQTGRTDQFDEAFWKGLETILDVWEREQYHEECSSYYFRRKGSYFTDTLSRDGKGALVKSGTGLTWSGFRPSDDACTYGYLIPSNMFATVVLGYMVEIVSQVSGQSQRQKAIGKRAGKLRQQIREAIETIGITKTEDFGEIYAYEVDGYGQYNLMDDANVPSLLSMTYLGYEPKRPEVAENTRRFLLSDANPYYYKGTAAAGIGSPHTPPSYIWHIALAVEGLTSTDKQEQKRILNTLLETDGGKALMHEGFHADDPGRYTREWFSWANAMYCELLLRYLDFI